MLRTSRANEPWYCRLGSGDNCESRRPHSGCEHSHKNCWVEREFFLRNCDSLVGKKIRASCKGWDFSLFFQFLLPATFFPFQMNTLKDGGILKLGKNEYAFWIAIRAYFGKQFPFCSGQPFFIFFFMTFSHWFTQWLRHSTLSICNEKGICGLNRTKRELCNAV